MVNDGSQGRQLDPRETQPCPDSLEAVDVSKSFGGIHALQSVSLHLMPGQILGLIGPNGSGKTTLLNLISGLLSPSSGKIAVAGRDITGLPPHKIAHMGIGRTFQTIRLFANLTVLENVQVAASTTGQTPASSSWYHRARDVLHRVGISHLAGQLAGTLPYGAQRRVEIARALALEPRYLLVDEPAAGMNEEEANELKERFKAIRQEAGCGMLVVDHDLHFIMQLCDQVVVLNEGRKISQGSPQSVYNDPSVVEAYLGEKAAQGLRDSKPG
jgi:ABC-type branched-subunit amino acid transport system ATPase component